MSDSNFTGTTATVLCTKLDCLKIKLLSLPSAAHYQKTKKKIEISVDDKVEWSYKWTDTFAPPSGQDLLIPLSSTVKVSLKGKHRVRNHVLGSYSGRIIDFVLDNETQVTLEDDRHVTCATVTMCLSPVVDYQLAVNGSVDASLTRLDNNPRLEEGLDDIDQAISAMQTMDYAVETYGKYVTPLGQALRLMIKLIDNVAEAHPLLKVGWTLLSSVYTAVQQQRVDDRDVRGLAESLRELIGVAGDCPMAEIKGTPDVIQCIERLAFEVASLIDEYTKRSFIVRLGKGQVTDIKARIKECQVELKDLYEKLRTRIGAYTAKRVEEVHKRVKESQEDAKRRDAQKLFDQIREWLKPHDSSINHKSARDACVEGTGTWVAKDERFRKWLNEPGKTLWILGAPGFGKTVLFSTSVETVRGHESALGSTSCCACFYFDARESGGASQRFETLLRSILHQLCSKQAVTPDAMKRLYGVDAKEHPQPTLSQLRTTLGEVVKGFDEVYILIDALDECDSQADLLDWMQSLQSTTQGLHLLVTSRPERIIEDRMSNFSHVRISLNSELLDDDIKTYVDERVEASADLKLLMTEGMKKKLRVKGDGMFRLVAFWIEELKHCLNRKDITEKLEQLPTSLHAMYSSMVSKINPSHLPYARAIMRWLLCSVRQLTLTEIAMVVGFVSSTGRPAFDEDRCFGNPRAVLDVCGGLVVMSQDGVTLAHLTVKEFLLEQESALHVNEPDAHSFIARSCLTYLLDQFQRRVPAGVESFPLHDYAVENWMKHASSTRDIEDINSVTYELALEVLHPQHETFRLWSSAWDTTAYSWEKDTYSTPLFVSAGWGFQNLTARLLILGVCAATQSKSHRTALHLACASGHLEVAKILLDGPSIMMNPAVVVSHGQINVIELANVNAQGENSGTPLSSACSARHMDIVKLLIEKGADVNAQGEGSDTPLCSACYGGCIDIVELLLEEGADVNAQGQYSNTPLSSACDGGHINIVRLLLKKGANVNPQGQYSNTPLWFACSCGDIDIVKLLLEKGADVTPLGEGSETPLFSACSHGDIDIVKLLLEKGADVNAQAQYSEAPLFSACSRGDIDIVKLLLEKGADVNVQSQYSNTPLSSACDGGHINVVKLLLEKGAHINAQGQYSETPLFSACSRGDTDIVKLLLEKGADVNPLGEDSETPLCSACSAGHINIVKLLLEKGADVNPQCQYSNTPLWFACSCGDIDIVKLLLEKGADVNPLSGGSETPLCSACSHGDIDIVKLLLEKGAHINAQAQYSETPLFSACSCGDIDIVKLLLEMGADVNLLGGSSETPLCSACSHGHIDIVRLLLEKGADVNAQGEGSETPLSSACSHGHIDIVRLLLERGADVDALGRYSNTPLYSACSCGDMDVIKLLLEKGADVNAHGRYSYTPLYSACSRSDMVIVKLLLEKGADVNPLGGGSDTPLCSACSHGDIDIVKLLLEKGADINPLGKGPGAPLCSACSHGHIDIVKLLLEKGASVNPLGGGSETPLCSACSAGHIDIVKLLLEKGADVNAQGEGSETPLHSACSGVVTKPLLQQGANVNAHGKNFSTRFGSACSRGDSAIIELLLRSGADVNARDDDSNTPLHLASRTGQLELILLLLDNGAHPHVQNNDLKTPLDLVRETVDMFLSADDYDDPVDFEHCNKIIAVLSVTPSVPLTAEL